MDLQTNQLTELEKLWLTDSSAAPLPGSIVPCLMCAKPILMPKYTGVPDQICPDCYNTYQDCCSIICSRCKVCVAKVKPGVTDTGFYIRPRSVLHLDACSVCNPDLIESRIIEMDLWYDQIGKHRKLIVPIRNMEVRK